MISVTSLFEGIVDNYSNQRFQVAAKFLNGAQVLCTEGCVDKFVSGTEKYVNPEGMLGAYGAKSGDRRFGLGGIWAIEEKLVSVRFQMIVHLNSVPDFFEKLSPELGVIDPVSGLVAAHKSLKNSSFLLSGITGRRLDDFSLREDQQQLQPQLEIQGIDFELIVKSCQKRSQDAQRVVRKTIGGPEVVGTRTPEQ